MIGQNKLFWLNAPVLATLAHLPVAQKAADIFAGVEPGTVTLLKGELGSGKSLVSPLVLASKFDGGVLVLVPSVDVARDNAERLAELSGYGWEVGREIGLFAGGTHRWGSMVMVATYGSFIANQRIHGWEWKAILLDESHTEVWQVEVSRSDVYARLMEGREVAVMEITATMDRAKLAGYWGHEAITVRVHEIPGKSARKREIVRETVRTVALTAQERVLAGDRFVMVVQPGFREVEEVASRLQTWVGQQHTCTNVSVYSYHGETDKDEVWEILSRVGKGEQRVVVCTPRLLTGFNHEDLDTIVTDGRAKYPYSSASGVEELRVGDMSQLELTQAMGRVGRFAKDGRLILVSENGYEYRKAVQVPEVARLSALPLCLSLCALGRDPRKVYFCNKPRDVEESMRLLTAWGFVTDDGRITQQGSLADEIEIRLDVAKFLLSVMGDADTDVSVKVAAVLLAAAVEGGGVARMFDKDGRAVYPPVVDRGSDWLNELGLYASALRERNQEWVSGNGLRRVRAVTYRIIEAVGTSEIYNFLGQDLFKEEPEKSVRQKGNGNGQESPKQRSWKRIGKRVALGVEGANVLKAHIAAMMAAIGRLYKGYSSRRGMGGEDKAGNTYSVARESNASLSVGGTFCANKKVIHPRNGKSEFTVLTDVTAFSSAVCHEIARIAPEVVVVESGLDPQYNADLDQVTSVSRTRIGTWTLSDERVPDLGHPEAPRVFAEWLAGQMLG